MMKFILAFILIITTILYLTLQKEKREITSVKLGLSIPKSGVMSAWGESVYKGANAYFDYINKNNLYDKKIELITYDDKYVPDLTVENIKKLIEKDIFALFAFVGTPTTKKIMPLLDRYDIPFIAPFTGATFLRNGLNQNIINFRASYMQEIDAIVKYLYQNKGIKKFAIFYQNDDYGEEGYISLLHALNKQNLKLCGEGTYKRNTLAIRHAYYDIKKSKPDAILMIGAYQANVLFIKKSKQDNQFKDTIFCNISFGNSNAMVKELNGKYKNLLFSQVVPSYEDTTKKSIVEYRKLMINHYGDKHLDFISLEAFLASKMVVSALQQVEGALTQKKFLKAIKSLPSSTLNDIGIKYKDHQFHNHIYLFKYLNKHFKEINHEL